MLNVYDVMPTAFQAALKEEYVTDLAVRDNGNGYITRYGGTECIGPQDDVVEKMLCLAAFQSGQIINPEHKTLECRLPNGERLTGKRPEAGIAWTVTIRVPMKRRLTWQEQISFKTVTETQARWIDDRVGEGASIALVGKMSTGKTHMLSTILGSKHLEDKVTVKLEAVVEIFGPPQCTTYSVKSAADFEDARAKMLRESAEVCIMGEARTPQEMMEVMNTAGTGHQTFTTFHADDLETAPHRIAEMLLDGGSRLKQDEVHAKVARSFDYFVLMEKMKDGRRVVTAIAALEMREGIAVPTDVMSTETNSMKEI